jgi:hypothetical protein
MRIDPVRHVHSAANDAGFTLQPEHGTPLIEMRADRASGGCIAGGVEWRDVTMCTLPRRTGTEGGGVGETCLEQVEFVRHHEPMCLAKRLTERTVLNEYTARLLAKADELLVARADLRAMLAFDTFVPTSKISHDSEYKNRPQNGTLLTALEEMLRLNEDATLFMPPASLADDALWSASVNCERALKPLIDICVHSATAAGAAVEGLKFAIVQPTNDTLRRCNELIKFMVSDVEWRVITGSPDFDGAGVPSVSVERCDLATEELGSDAQGWADAVVVDNLLHTVDDVTQYLNKVMQVRNLLLFFLQFYRNFSDNPFERVHNRKRNHVAL